MKKFIFALFCTLVLFSYKSLAFECINADKPVASVALTRVKYIGENKGKPIVQIEDKKDQVLKDSYYIILGKIYEVSYRYGDLCFKPIFKAEEFVDLDKLPEILPLHLYNYDGKIVNYIPFYEGKLYYLLEKVKFQNRFYIQLDDKYLEFDDWISVKKVKILY